MRHIRIAVLSGVVATVIISGCGSNTNKDAAPSATAAAAVPAGGADPAAELCPPEVLFASDDTELVAFLSGLKLPANVWVANGRVSTQGDKPGLVGVAIDLCVKGSSSAADLRPIATMIAAALKPTDLGARTFALYVSDMDVTYKNEAKVKDPEYQVHLWNGKPSASAENQRWEVLAG
ncbi:hypothetical protein [Nocardia sp. NPDC052112]|uniref:hypothetical protein n=1 Tax=Nocardia sp. NPDC052112 TaxID=3155646 RepID=UPI003413A492